MYIQKPSDYEALVTPYQQRLLQFGVDDSKIYLSEASNSVFKAFTNGFTPDETTRSYDERKHAILDGGFVTTSFDGTSTIVITLKPTTIIADNVLIVIKDDVTVDVDVETLNESGEILLFLSYKYIKSVYENAPLIKALYYDGTTFTPDDFISDTDGVILNIIRFQKTGSLVSEITTVVDNPYIQVIKKFKTINGDDYEIAPLANFWYRIIEGYHELHTRRQEFVIDDANMWIQEIPNFGIGVNGTFHSTELNIDLIQRKNCIVQCYINDVKIDPTAIQHVSDTKVKVWMPADWATQPVLPSMSIIIVG